MLPHGPISRHFLVLSPRAALAVKQDTAEMPEWGINTECQTEGVLDYELLE